MLRPGSDLSPHPFLAHLYSYLHLLVPWWARAPATRAVRRAPWGEPPAAASRSRLAWLSPGGYAGRAHTIPILQVKVFSAILAVTWLNHPLHIALCRAPALQVGVFSRPFCCDLAQTSLLIPFSPTSTLTFTFSCPGGRGRRQREQRGGPRGESPPQLLRVAAWLGCRQAAVLAAPILSPSSRSKYFPPFLL